MCTTVDLPDTIFREMKIRAASEGKTIKEIILEGVSLRLGGPAPTQRVAASRRSRFPVIKSSEPRSLKLGEEGVYEFIPFP